jgi:helicase MOV-10
MTWNMLHYTLSTAKAFQQHQQHHHHHKQHFNTKLTNPHVASSSSSSSAAAAAASSFATSLDVWEFNVRFVPSNTLYQRCLAALDWLIHSYQDQPARAMELLFPTHAPHVMIQQHAQNLTIHGSSSQHHPQNNSTTMEWSRELNHQQADFVRMVLHRTQYPSTDEVRGPMVLTGCAGTGKTKTMLAAVHAILQVPPVSENPSTQYRILVCAPSHTAADVITKRLGLTWNAHQLFRLFDSERPVETVPPDVLKFCRQSTDDHTGTFTLPSAKEMLQFQIIVCTCSDAHILYRIGMTNQQLREQRRCFRTYLETACRGTNLSCTLQGVEDTHFTHLFIDEAAQSSEVETLIPFSVVVDPVVPGPRKVEIALVGDPRQLSPEVYSAEAAKAGLEKSFMERLLHRPVQCLGYGRDHMLGPDMVGMEDWLRYSFQHHGQEQLSVFLTSNYRGHVSFLMMPSVLFYSDKLQSVDHDNRDEKGETFWPEKLRWVESLSNPVVLDSNRIPAIPDEVRCRKQYSWPLHFRGVAGKDASVTIQSGFASRSWTNEIEAKNIVEIVETLTKLGLSSRSIGIMAPFRGQVVLIRKLLRANNLGAINVGTIEDYQAVEYDVIILSCTRSTEAFVAHDVEHRMGIIGQPKRSNVALTRAQNLFIVVGHPDVLVKDIVWRQFLLFCFRNGLYYGEAPAQQSKYLNWDASRKLVRCLPTIATRETDDETLLAVGTIERLLRNA